MLGEQGGPEACPEVCVLVWATRTVPTLPVKSDPSFNEQVCALYVLLIALGEEPAVPSPGPVTCFAGSVTWLTHCESPKQGLTRASGVSAGTNSCGPTATGGAGDSLKYFTCILSLHL